MNGACSRWTIVEPQPLPVEGCRAEFIKGFFPEDLSNKKYDMVIHTHYFEHVENIQQFLENVTRFIRINGKMIFSLPDMKPMLEKYMTSILNFEHTFLITEEYLDFILSKNGFSIDKKQHYGNGHSLIYVTTYTGHPQHVRLPDDMYSLNKNTILDYILYHQKIVASWNERIEQETRSCYLFGAHMTTQFFVAYGLKIDKIQAILDNDTYKIGKRVGGIEKEICSPTCLKGLKEAVIILPNSPYSQEIKADILENINPNVEFLE